MKILHSEQIRKADAYTIEHEPIASIDLMERAANECCSWLKAHLGNQQHFKVFVGPGNNGGDGLAIARILSGDRCKPEVFLLSAPERLSPDAFINYERLIKQGSATVSILGEQKTFPEIAGSDIVIDAMFGSGLSRPLNGLAAGIVNHINQSGAKVIAIDLPSGLYCDSNTNNDTDAVIQACDTLTFQLPKLAFFFPENQCFTGNWHILDIALLRKAIDDQDSNYFFIGIEDISLSLKPRKKFSHKGTYGHALLIAGSYGKTGAAVLSSKACLRAGAGLLTVHIAAKGYEILQTSIPEAMVSIDPGSDYISSLPDLSKFNAVGVGPGIGTNDFTGFMLHKLLTTAKIPLVIDADALNLLSLHPEWLSHLPENSILTPHPGEFDRLAGPSENGFERHQKQIDFAKKHNVIVVLKGAYTSVANPDGNCWFNSTGNPGMATAGSGDALTGVILSLLAQRYTPVHAALIGVYIHGLSGDIASKVIGEEALLASDIIDHLGKAFISIKSTEIKFQT